MLKRQSRGFNRLAWLATTFAWFLATRRIPTDQAPSEHNPLAGEVAADNILVNCAAPGRILTSRTEVLDRALAEKTGRPIEQIRSERVAAVPLKRYGTPEEFGAVVAFLASERASYVTGSIVRVDGGAVFAKPFRARLADARFPFVESGLFDF